MEPKPLVTERERPHGPPVPESMARHPAFLLAKTHALAHEIGVRALKTHGLTLKHYGCLTLLAEEGPVSQQALGERMRVDRTTIVTVVDDLERQGFVVRRRDPRDRRAYALEVTAEGREWLSKASRDVADAEDEIFAPLDPDERAELSRLLRKLLRR
jgi:DNA-binding MarR family transcriptional regulator